MTSLRVSAVALAAAIVASPVAALAQDMALTAGITATSNYVSNGVSVSDDNPALQGYVEFEASGFYGGVWASTVEDDVDDSETDLYIGYRGEFGQGATYDVSYTRYFYNNSGNCCGELAFSLGVPVTQAVEVSGEIAIDPGTRDTSLSLGLDYALNDKIGLAAEIGTVEDAQNFGSIGVSYALTDAAAVDLSYHDSNVDHGIVVLSLSYDMTLFSR